MLFRSKVVLSTKLNLPTKEGAKLYYSIREVADMFEVNTSLLRYWEYQFPSLKPQKTRAGVRKYTLDDIEHIKLIYYLVKEKGMTLKGARKKLTVNKETTLKRAELLSRLNAIKAELLSMREELDRR